MNEHNEGATGADKHIKASILRTFEPFTEAITDKIWNLPVSIEQKASLSMSVSALIVGNIAGRFASHHFSESLISAAQNVTIQTQPETPAQKTKGARDDKGN